MTAQRRTRSNFALQRACQWARELGAPLVIFEPLRVDYPWASARTHAFVIEGMQDNAGRLAKAGVTYIPWVEPSAGAGKGVLAALARHARVVVADDAPIFFLRRALARAAEDVGVRMEAVDSCGLLPLAATARDYPSAASFRRVLQRDLAAHLDAWPAPDPLASLPRGVTLAPGTITAIRRVLGEGRAPGSGGLGSEIGGTRAHAEALIASLPVDHSVTVAPERGGSQAARARLRSFVNEGLSAYAEGRNHPDHPIASGLSPWLHFGHIGTHEILARIARAYEWTPANLAPRPTGGREGWWGLPGGPQAFLDELVTWRELGLNFCAHRDDTDRWESLPAWARETLELHARDRRPWIYELETLECALTHDALWNAAQRQLVGEGRIHNYLRMLWGKKILEWSAHPKQALAAMIHLNNKYALDGRDPNSYSGIQWVLGRYDRPWGPERPIFGKIRYMSSDNTRRKVHVTEYLQRWGQAPAQRSVLA